MWVHGAKSDDVTIMEKILSSMTPKFNFVVCSIEESKDIDELSLGELQSSLMVHEQKLNQQDKDKPTLQASTTCQSLVSNKIDKKQHKGSIDYKNQQQQQSGHQSYDPSRRGRGRGRGRVGSRSASHKSS